jgi:hypothetical protein
MLNLCSICTSASLSIHSLLILYSFCSRSCILQFWPVHNPCSFPSITGRRGEQLSLTDCVCSTSRRMSITRRTTLLRYTLLFHINQTTQNMRMHHYSPLPHTSQWLSPRCPVRAREELYMTLTEFCAPCCTCHQPHPTHHKQSQTNRSCHILGPHLPAI